MSFEGREGWRVAIVLRLVLSKTKGFLSTTRGLSNWKVWSGFHMHSVINKMPPRYRLETGFEFALFITCEKVIVKWILFLADEDLDALNLTVCFPVYSFITSCCRTILQMSVWQDWLFSLARVYPISTVDREISSLVMEMFRILLYHAVRLEYGGWRVWIDTLSILHTRVRKQSIRKETPGYRVTYSYGPS